MQLILHFLLTLGKQFMLWCVKHFMFLLASVCVLFRMCVSLCVCSCKNKNSQSEIIVTWYKYEL